MKTDTTPMRSMHRHLTTPGAAAHGHLLRCIAPWVAATLLAGCGGGGSDAAEQALAAAQAPARATVQLEGCVVDSEWLGAANTAVHVRAADGRSVGTAFTNARGVYVVTVPARSALVVDTSVAGPGGMAFNTGSSALTVASCLLAGI